MKAKKGENNFFIRDKKGFQLTLETIILIVLGVLVLIGVLFLIFGQNILDYFRNQPWYGSEERDEIVELSPEELINFKCDLIVGKIGKGNLDFSVKPYIYINNKKTYLYWVRKEGERAEVYLEGRKYEIGEYRDGKLFIGELFLDENSYEYAVYKEKLPSVDEMKALHESFKLEKVNYLCKNEEQLEEERKCIENCSVCRSSCLKGEVSIGKLDCKQVCCVSETEEKLENEDLAIKEFKIINWKASDKKTENLIGKEKISVVYGLEGLKKIEFKIDGNDFCYVLRTNEKVLKNDLMWVPSAEEKILELSAWLPKNKDKRVVKRLAVEAKLPGVTRDKYSDIIPEGYERGKAVKENEIYKEVSKAEARVESIFYVFGVWFDWSKKGGYTSATRDYKIKKINNKEVEISVYNVYPDELRWHELDCLKDFHVFGLGDKKLLEIEKLKQGLISALAKNCGW